jgi:hypothetical protein
MTCAHYNSVPMGRCAHPHGCEGPDHHSDPFGGIAIDPLIAAGCVKSVCFVRRPEFAGLAPNYWSAAEQGTVEISISTKPIVLDTGPPQPVAFACCRRSAADRSAADQSGDVP